MTHLRIKSFILAAALVLAVTPAWARSSGGYSSSRTPSFGGGSVSRTPSYGSSGGYSSGGGYSRGGSSTFGMPSAGDRSFNQERSGNALGQYRQQQELGRRSQEPQPAPQYAPAPNYGGGGGSFGGGQSYAPAGRTYYRDSQGRFESQSNWYRDRGWAPAPQQYYQQGPRSFGVWDGIFLWSLLNNLGRSGSGDWFSNHRDDAGYQQWRQEAERQAQTNTELRQKLDQLDSQLREKQGQPQDPAYLPPDVPASMAAAPTPERTPAVASARRGSAWVWPVLLVGAGGIGYLAYSRHKPSSTGGSPMSSPAPTTAIGQAANLFRHKLSGEGYTPDRFRVGMTIAVDPTPFILAGPATKVQAPETTTGQISVDAVGTASSGGTRLTRLYLPGERGMVQLHLDAAGLPDECRYFQTIDEITPADTNEWGAWLDPAEGMIGLPDFQTKDGKTYNRVWSPGQNRTPPRDLEETVQGLSGSRVVKAQAMLYAAPTNTAQAGPQPGPPTEYILVQAIEDGSRAYVQISAGLDINPTTLQLA